MTDPACISLRSRLRTDTRASHGVLDGCVSEFDLRTAEGLAQFLRMQSAALRATLPRAQGAATRDCIVDLSARADSDLSTLGVSPVANVVEMPPLHPLAIDYVIAGSRLGTQVLRQRWRAATDPAVCAAASYFSAPGYIDLWKSFCDTSGAMPAVGVIADRIVSDADRVLAMYLACARAANTTKGAVDA